MSQTASNSGKRKEEVLRTGGPHILLHFRNGKQAIFLHRSPLTRGCLFFFFLVRVCARVCVCGRLFLVVVRLLHRVMETCTVWWEPIKRAHSGFVRILHTSNHPYIHTSRNTGQYSVPGTPRERVRRVRGEFGGVFVFVRHASRHDGDPEVWVGFLEPQRRTAIGTCVLDAGAWRRAGHHCCSLVLRVSWGNGFVGLTNLCSGQKNARLGGSGLRGS